MPIETIVFYGALVLWAGLLAQGLRVSKWQGFMLFGIGLMLVLNIGYFVRGQGDAIAFFVSIYDLLDNVGVSSQGELPAALATCPDNACSIADNYDSHPAWGVAFHDRFANGPTLRRSLLFAHIGFNSIAFVLAHVQLAKPGTGSNARRHRILGRVAFGSVTAGTLCAVLLAREHGPVEEYGGIWSTLGFFSMAFVVYFCAIKTATTARSGDIRSHRVWMFRFLGSMWGAFWLFRVMLFVLGPLLRNVEAGAILICIWFSAPLGVLIAEWFRTRRPSGAVSDSSQAPAVV
ncbi:MAG: DUF2306 domain-containing protein [Acidimicrobiales bacterium]